METYNGTATSLDFRQLSPVLKRSSASNYKFSSGAAKVLQFDCRLLEILAGTKRKSDKPKATLTLGDRDFGVAFFSEDQHLKRFASPLLVALFLQDPT